MKDKYFLYDPEDGFETFDTEKECIVTANENIQNYLDDGWDESVVNVVCGIITHQATQVDRVDRPDNVDEECIGEDGDYWMEEWKYKCNYKMVEAKG